MMALERPKFAAALADIGDFETRVGWRFGSAVLAPLVKMVAPRDTYAVTCANGKLRVDGELRGIDSDALGRSVLPKWRRGKFSLIFNRGARGEPAELWFVDHESRDVVNAMERANETEGSRASMSSMSGDSATSEPMTEEEIVSATVEAMLADEPTNSFLHCGPNLGVLRRDVPRRRSPIAAHVFPRDARRARPRASPKPRFGSRHV